MLSDNLQRLRERIDSACIAAGRKSSEVSLLAVTKNHPRETVSTAMELGLSIFGENRVQEAVAKFEGLIGSVEVRLLGHLQSNKVKLVPGTFSWVESVDREVTAQQLSRRFSDHGSECQVLVQYNSTGEEQKSGFCDAEELLDCAMRISELPAISLRGVMTIGPFTSDRQAITRAFDKTRDVFNRLVALLPDAGIDTLSMGMTDDLESAIACGSTEVRVGTALFGSRPT